MYCGNYFLLIIKVVLGTFFSIFFCLQAVNTVLCIYLTCAVGLSDAILVAWRGLRWGIYSTSIWIKMSLCVIQWYASSYLYDNIVPHTLRLGVQTLVWTVILVMFWVEPDEIHTTSRFTILLSDVVRSSKFQVFVITVSIFFSVALTIKVTSEFIDLIHLIPGVLCRFLGSRVLSS